MCLREAFAPREVAKPGTTGWLMADGTDLLLGPRGPEARGFSVLYLPTKQIWFWIFYTKAQCLGPRSRRGMAAAVGATRPVHEAVPWAGAVPCPGAVSGHWLPGPVLRGCPAEGEQAALGWLGHAAFPVCAKLGLLVSQTLLLQSRWLPVTCVYVRK